MSEALYGISLCYFKLKEYEKALKSIEDAINLGIAKPKNLRYYKYLKAVCYKQLEDYKQAEKYYMEVCGDTIKVDINESIKYKLYEVFYKPNDGWYTDKKSSILDILQTSYFFTRFNELEHIFKLIEIRICKAGTLLFLNRNEIGVILQGQAIIYSHAADLDKSKIIAELNEGSIVGYSKIDNGAYTNTENWTYIKSTIELCVFPKVNFDVRVL